MCLTEMAKTSVVVDGGDHDGRRLPVSTWWTANHTRDVLCSPQALQRNQCSQQLKSALEHSGTTLPGTASSVHDTSLVSFTPSRCSCGPDNSTDIWLIWYTPMLVFTLRAYGSLSAWRIRPSATSRLALNAIYATSCKSPQWRV